MYLAFEALLSSRYPKSREERERDWLHRALASASQDLNLKSLPLDPVGELIDAILKVIYTDARLPLFHAKEGLTCFAPDESLDNRKAVSHALGLLTEIVLRMAALWFDARRAGGGVFFGWVYNAIRELLADPTAYASSYEGNFDTSAKDLSHPRFQTAARLETRLAPEYARGNAPAFISFATGKELSKIKPLRCLDLASKGKPLIACTLEAPLDLDGVFRFESLIHIRGSNENQPRSLFRR